MLINRQEPNTLKIVDLHVNNSLSEKLLGTTFDCKVKFNKRIKDICQKASQKLQDLQDLHYTWEQPKNVFLLMLSSSHNLIFPR